MYHKLVSKRKKYNCQYKYTSYHVEIYTSIAGSNKAACVIASSYHISQAGFDITVYLGC